MNATGNSQSTDPRVAAYLDALARALYGLPEPSRSEVYDEIRQHIDDQLAERGDDLSAVPEILDRLGDPAEIAREAGAGYVPPGGYPPGFPSPGGYPSAPPRSRRVHEILAVVLLAIGGFVFLVGWVVGVVLLWTSDRFTKADKIIGTLLVPGGFALSFLVAVAGVFVSTGSGRTCQEVDSGSASGAVTTIQTTCTGGTPVLARILVIVLLLVLVFGPVYTVVRLSRRVAGM